ncbi:histone-lysine N-methyltransferase SUV39H2-like [Antedon mediterranea]|uniref:histone-lysine N-methyltransferase SUV39H2-like n=1 Tax=Antedon mediterranea TaxID=105859 RepID=UPI003AF5D4A3
MPAESEDDDSYEVEDIVDCCKDSDGAEWYMVKWVGYSSSENTWEPRQNLNCPAIIKRYQSRRSKKRRRQEINQTLSKKMKVEGPIVPIDLTCQAKRVKRHLLKWQNDLNEIIGNVAPITVENKVDLEGPPKNFTYITDYKAGPGVFIPNDPIVGCECDNCYSADDGCCTHNSGTAMAYTLKGKIKVQPGTPVYECNKLCKCGMRCKNRVVQKGRKVPLSIFKTDNGRGWGVKCLKDIKKNCFVMEYVGEVIGNEEAERRGQEYDCNGRTYLFDLDYNESDCPYVVDAGKYGNVAHFVNHSCDPNLVVYGVWIDTLDVRFPRIALFACRDISAGEELTFDYQMTGATGMPQATSKGDSPEKNSNTPEKNRSTPEKNRSTPEKNRSTPEKNSNTPDKNSNTPDKNWNTPDKNRNTLSSENSIAKLEPIPCRCGADNCHGFLY